MKMSIRIVGVVAVFLLPALLVFCSQAEEPPRSTDGITEARGTVLRATEGEVLVLRRPGGGRVTVKVDPVNTGSSRVAMGTQLMPVGYRIPDHRHQSQDEILFVYQGRGTATLGERQVALEPGTTIYVPEGVWHGVVNDSDEPAEIIWVVAPPGLERFFRDMGAPPGVDVAPLSGEEAAEISRKHGVIPKTD